MNCSIAVNFIADFQEQEEQIPRKQLRDISNVLQMTTNE